MKKKKIAPILDVSSIATAGLGLSGCRDGWKPTTSEYYDIIPLTGEATDYNNPDNWMYKEVNGKQKVDLLYFYPTVTVKADNMAVHNITREMKDSAHYAFAETGSAFASYTNVFAPYYTQLPITISFDVLIPYCKKYNIDPTKIKTYFDIIIYSQVRTDVYAALDYYFQHWNKGKPFILAGHSQGSAVIQIVLAEYMKAHPEYLKNMVAAYPIGFSVSKAYLKANPHLKFATGETDTGVIVSWNTEGPGGTKPSAVLQKESLNINPLNWKTDATPAGVELNKGKLVPIHYLHTWEIKQATADATIDPIRGVLINTKNTDYETNPGFGDRSLHTYDYAEYYANIKKNGLKRIKNFLK